MTTGVLGIYNIAFKFGGKARLMSCIDTIRKYIYKTAAGQIIFSWCHISFLLDHFLYENLDVGKINPIGNMSPK